MPTAPRPADRPEPAGIITRDEIEEFRELSETHGVLEKNLSVIRSRLVAKVKAGVKCELGPWIPQLVRMESRRFSAAAVAAALGVEVMEEIRVGLTPTVTEIFGLIPREGWVDDSEDGDFI